MDVINRHKVEVDQNFASQALRNRAPAHLIVRPSSKRIRSPFVAYRTISVGIRCSEAPVNASKGVMTMADYAMRERTVREAVSGGGLLVDAQWEAKEGQRSEEHTSELQ